jgi:hypothetical protein
MISATANTGNTQYKTFAAIDSLCFSVMSTSVSLTYRFPFKEMGFNKLQYRRKNRPD